MNKIFYVGIMLCFAALGMMFPTNGNTLYGTVETDIKVYSTVTLEDNFCDSSIMVVMKASHSQIVTETTSQNSILLDNTIFSDMGVIEIRDLTALPSENTERTKARHKQI